MIRKLFLILFTIYATALKKRHFSKNSSFLKFGTFLALFILGLANYIENLFRECCKLKRSIQFTERVQFNKGLQLTSAFHSTNPFYLTSPFYLISPSRLNKKFPVTNAFTMIEGFQSAKGFSRTDKCAYNYSRKFFASLLLLVFGLLSMSSKVFADGSKDLYPLGAKGNRASMYSTSSTNTHQSFPFKTQGTHYVYARKGEWITVASSAQGIGQGKIRLTTPRGAVSTQVSGNIPGRASELAGPMQPEMEATGNFYKPYAIKVPDNDEGIWMIEFLPTGAANSTSDPRASDISAGGTDWTQNNEVFIVAWDISVRNTGNTQWIPGRVYANILNLGVSGAYANSEKSYYGANYVLTKDGRAYYVQNNGNNGYGFTFFANNKGSTNAAGEAIYKSLNFSDDRVRTNMQDPRAPDDDTKNLITHKLFYTKPALDLPESAPVWLSGRARTTWLKRDAIVPQVQNVNFVGSEGTPGQGSQKGGYISFTANVPGSYRIVIPLGDGKDRVLTGTAVQGANRILWDGRDGLGAVVPANSVIPQVKVRLTSAEVHFPFIDMEINPNGIIIELTRNTDQNTPAADAYQVLRTSTDESVYSDRIYWNDIDISSNPAGKSNPTVNITEGISSNLNGHKWGIYTSNGDYHYGDVRSMDTYTYILSNDGAQDLNVAIKVADLKIAGITPSVTSVPIDGTVSFTVNVANDGPSDITGGKFKFTAPAGFTISTATLVASTCGSETSRGIAGNSFESVVDLKNGCVLSYVITGIADAVLKGQFIPVTASILRPNDVTDPDASNKVFEERPTDVNYECQNGVANGPKNCNNIFSNAAVYVENPSVTLIKTGSLNSGRDVITYSFTMKNIGDVTLRNLILTDTKLAGPFTFNPAGDLAPDRTTRVSVVYTLTQADRDAGKVVNTATVVGISPAGQQVKDISGTTADNDIETTTPIPEAPKITLVKTGQLSEDKNTITYTFRVKNTGDVTLSDIQLKDEKLDGPFTFNPSGALAPGASTVAAFVYTITQADRDLRRVENTATVRGTSPAGRTVTDISGTAEDNDAKTITPVPEAPAISLLKKGKLSEDKTTITYDFIIKNTGDVTLKTIVLTDAKLRGPFLLTPGGPLAPGQSATGTFVYTVTQADRDAGKVINTARVTAQSPANTPVSDISGNTETDDNPTETPIAENPSISLVKTGVLNSDKSTITYSFTIKNTGDVTLRDVTFNDVKLTSPVVFRPTGPLAPGATKTGTAVYTITQAEKNARIVRNTATVTGLSPANVLVRDVSGSEQNNDTETTVEVPETPGIDIKKSGVLSDDGHRITYTFELINIGNVTLKYLTLKDTKVPAFTINPETELQPGNSLFFTAVYAITIGEKDSRRVGNLASVSGLSPYGSLVEDRAVNYITVPERPAIKLRKSGVLSADQKTITYTFLVTNTGNVSLNPLKLTDEKINLPVTFELTTRGLIFGTTTTGTAVYTVTQADRDLGSVTNTAKIEGTSPSGLVVSDISGTTITDDIPTVISLTQNPAVRLVKKGVVSSDGNTITYSFTITNTGNVTLKDFKLTDPKLAAPIVIAANEALSPGDSKIYTAVYTISQTEKNEGKVINTAFAEALSPKGDKVTDISGTELTNDNPTETAVPQRPEIKLVKTGRLSSDGNSIRYSFSITNTGNVTLNKLSLSDVKLANPFVIDQNETLLPGAFKDFTATYLITQLEKDAGKVVNTATAKGVSFLGTEVTATSGTAIGNTTPTEVAIPQHPAIKLIKTGLKSSNGNTVTYTFELHNTGNVTLQELSLTDAKLAVPLVIPVADVIVPGASNTYTAVYTITQADRDAGKITNTAIAKGKSQLGVEVSDVSGATLSDNIPTETELPQHPQIKLLKSGVLDAAGKNITYTFALSNTGDVSLKNLSLNDAKLPAAVVIDPAEILLPGASKEYKANYTVTQSEIDAGKVINTAIGKGISPKNVTVTALSGTALTNNDNTEVAIPQEPKISLIKTGRISNDGLNITYTFRLTNTGNVTLNKLSIADVKLATPLQIDPIVSLIPGAFREFSAEYVIKQSEREAGRVENTAEGIGFSALGEEARDISGTSLTDDLPTEVLVPQNPSIALLKTGVLTADQHTVNYTFRVTNTGNVKLNKLILTDVKLATPVLIDANEALLPNESKTFTASYTVSQAEKEAGRITNTATIKGTTQLGREVSDVSGTAISNDDPTVISFPQHPSVALVKTGVLSSDGNTITYRFSVTNTGDVTLNKLSLTDAKLSAPIVIPADLVLLPAASKDFIAVYNVTQGEKDNGKVTNTAIVKGLSPKSIEVTDVSGTNLQNHTPTVVVIPENPAISLVKTALLSSDKNTLSYTFRVTNTGNVSLKNLNLRDDKLAAPIVIDPVLILLPGDSKEFSATYTITQTEKNSKRVSNTAVVTALSAKGTPVTDVSGTAQDNDAPTIVVVPPVTGLTLTKITSGNIPSTIGESLIYELKVTNTGTVTVYNVVITDPNAVIAPGTTIAALQPNQSVVLSATHVLKQADIDAGKVINQALAEGTDPDGGDVGSPSDDPSTPGSNDPTVTPIAQQGAIALVKTGAVNENSTRITYTFTITNTGNVTLDQLVLTDPMLGGNINLNTLNLEPGKSTTVTHTYQVTQQDRNSGRVSNTATVKGNTPAGSQVTDISGTELQNDLPTVVVIGSKPGIVLIKTGTMMGDFSSISYVFEVINTGNVTLNNLKITDEKLSTEVLLGKSSIEPGERLIAAVIYTITDQERRDGLVVNTATVTGTSPIGETVTDISGTAANNDLPTEHIIDSAPRALNDNSSTIINQPVTFSVTENDLPSFNGLDNGSVVVVKFPDNGQVSVNPDGTTIYTPNRGYSGNDQFTYTVTDLKGKLSNVALVSLNVIPIPLFIPNTFTPNGDGKNDTFKIIGRESYDAIELTVINRWGSEVYKNNNYLDEWTGSNLSEGTYYYIIILKKGSDKTTKKGWILLKR